MEEAFGRAYVEKNDKTFIQDNEVWNLIVSWFVGSLLNVILEVVSIIISQSS